MMHVEQPNVERGAKVARVLAGAWRAEDALPSLEVSPSDLEAVAGQLMNTGAGALAWHHIRRDAALRVSPAAAELAQSYRQHALTYRRLAQPIKIILAALANAGIRTLLIKGIVNARLYSQPFLRPFGDVDVVIEKSNYDAARKVFEAHAKDSYVVDLHLTDKRDFAELDERSQAIRVDEIVARAFGEEDHLRFLCAHFIKHGAYRPIWLCDVAAAIEARRASFEWQLCLGKDPTRANWVRACCALAGRLLEARIEDTPLLDDREKLPRWLIDDVCRAWSSNLYKYPDCILMPPFSQTWRTPTKVFAALKRRVPSAVRASFMMRARLDEQARLPLQLACFARGAWLYARHPFDSARRIDTVTERQKISFV